MALYLRFDFFPKNIWANIVNFKKKLAPPNLAARIVLFNFLGLISLLVGLNFFSQSRQSLIYARVQSLMTQGHMISAALSAATLMDTGEIVLDPDKFLEQFEKADRTPTDKNTSFVMTSEEIVPVLRRLLTSRDQFLSDLRALVYDKDGALLADTSSFPQFQQKRISVYAPQENNFFENFFKKIEKKLFSVNYSYFEEYRPSNGKNFPEVIAALNGASVSVVRLNVKKEVIVAVAVPIQKFRTTLGVLILSTRGGEIDQIISNEHWIAFLTFLFVLLVSSVLAVALARHIAEPVRLLVRAAERVRIKGGERIEIPDFSNRSDEIGHLSKALREMTCSLYERIEAIESFAADVSHELKNPLTSLRSALELFPQAKIEQQKQRLLSIALEDVGRLDRLITDISDASRLDAELARSKAEVFDLLPLLQTLLDGYNFVSQKENVDIEFLVLPSFLEKKPSSEGGFFISGHGQRIGQVFRNLLDNALSFTPQGKKIQVILEKLGGWVHVRVEDEGTGISADEFEKIFERFYTDRPHNFFGKNSGLGLFISRQIVEAYGGKITACNKIIEEHGIKRVVGACFCVQFPYTRKSQNGE